MQRTLFMVAAWAAVGLWACDEATSPLVDLGPDQGRDMAAQDFEVLDHAPADRGQPDRGQPDQRPPDAPVPDAPVPDAPVPDQLVPDLAAPDLLVPDLAAPDLPVPDQTVPDQLPPDLVKQCTAHAQCAKGQVCCGKLCVAGQCCATPDCPVGQVCKNKQCGPCATDKECATGENCIKGACTKCVQRKLLIYSLQPAKSSPAYEKLFSGLAASLKNLGYNVTFDNRAGTATLSLSYLQKYDLVIFGSGCGGASGMPSAADLAGLKAYYLAGGSFVIVTDDSWGDSQAPGSCHTRVNPIANTLGVSFSGSVNNVGHGCAAINATHKVLQGIKLGRYTSAKMTLTGKVAWGADKPKFIGTLKNGQPAEAMIDYALGKHGAALFSPDFGSMSSGCDGVNYVKNILTHLGCR